MNVTRLCGDQRLVALDKVSGCDYVRAIFAAWRAGDLVVPVAAGGQLPDIGLPIAERVVPKAGGGWFGEVISLDMGDALAQVSMTSGTTGQPKAILLARRALSDATHRLIDVMALDRDVREYLAVPVTYSFGLGRARAIAAVDGKAYLPDHGFRVDEFAAMLRTGEVNSLSAVPTLLRLVLAQRALFEDCGAGLRWLEIGSQYMSGAEKAQIRQLFPNARIVQHYGLTEASRSTFLRIDGAPEAALESVGAPVGDVRIKIDDDGLICVSGSHVADGQVIDGEVIKLIDDEGWLRTNDRGAIVDGLLFYHGRADDVMNVSGIKVSAEHFERELSAKIDFNVNYMAVFGRADPLRGQSVMVVHLPEVDGPALARAARAVAADIGLGAADVTVMQVDHIPHTETGKVQRRRLAELYGQAPSVPALAASAAGMSNANEHMSSRELEIASIWQEALGVASVGRDDSFFEIGGDSLSAITVALSAEQRGMPKEIMALMFQGRTVAEIAAVLDGDHSVAERSGTALLGDTINAMRGVLVLLIIAAHWMPFVLERMGETGAITQKFADLLFHMGTPGFAMIFGAGVSFFYTPAFDRSPGHIWSKIRSNMKFLASGVAVIGLIHAIRLALTGGFGPIWPEQIFFTAILSYFLIMPTVPLLIKIARITHSVVINALTMAVFFLLTLVVFQGAFAENLTGFPNLIRLMIVTPYGYPQMAAAACIGVAIGHWMRSNSGNPHLVRKLFQIGALCVLGGFLIVHYSGGIFANPRAPHFFLLYAGILFLLAALIRRLVETGSAFFVIKSLVLIGLLSFPAYVGHIMVVPIKDILGTLHFPYVVALGLALALFFTAAFFAMKHLNRLYYPKIGDSDAAGAGLPPISAARI